MGKLRDKVAVVTGASRGIGRSIAQTLAKDDALVVVHYGHNLKAAEETVEAIRSAGNSAFALGADLASVEEIERFFVLLDAKLTEHTGSVQIDILVNNAGVSSPA